MQRLIRSFNTLTDPLKETLQEQYPDGIDATHIKTIPTAKGEILRVIELRTPDAMYLIKINPESRAEIEEFLDSDDAGASPDDDADEDATMDAGDDGDVDDTASGSDDDDDDVDSDAPDADGDEDGDED